MENVANLANEKKYPAFVHFLNVLRDNKYHVKFEVVNTSEYGIPQNRKRLVLLASRLGDISLIEP
jgi:DNA (cytosine-5)-methyltransferase 1